MGKKWNILYLALKQNHLFIYVFSDFIFLLHNSSLLNMPVILYLFFLPVLMLCFLSFSPCLIFCGCIYTFHSLCFHIIFFLNVSLSLFLFPFVPLPFFNYLPLLLSMSFSVSPFPVTNTITHRVFSCKFIRNGDKYFESNGN